MPPHVVTADVLRAFRQQPGKSAPSLLRPVQYAAGAIAVAAVLIGSNRLLNGQPPVVTNRTALSVTSPDLAQELEHRVNNANASARAHNSENAPGTAFAHPSIQQVAMGAPLPVAASENPMIWQDDLAFIHSGVDDAMARWGHISVESAERLQREIDRTIRTGDSFVTVEFPRLASMNSGGMEAAARAYQQEREVVDARLARKLNETVKGLPFSDLCAQWTAQTGVEFTAAKTVADDKITLFCKERPVRDMMRAITQVFGFKWRRSGEPGKYTYEVYQDLRGQLMEEELRNKDRNEALIALDQEMQRFAKFKDLTPEQAKAAAETASPEDKEILDKLAGPGWAAAHLYGNLSQDQLSALRSGQDLQFSSMPGQGEHAMPNEIGKAALDGTKNAQVFTDDKGRPTGLRMGPNQPEDRPFKRPSDFPEARSLASMKMNANDLGSIELEGGGGFGISSGDSSLAGMSGDVIATGVSPSVKNPKNAESNSKLATQPALQAKISIEPKPSCTLTADPYAGGDAAGKRCTSADVMLEIHKATGMDVVGDYYTKLYTPGDLHASEATIFAVLNLLCDQMRVRWTRGDGWLQFRSTSFFNDRLKEVPDRLLSQLSESRKKNGKLMPDDYVQIAQLTNAQLDAKSSTQGARAIYGLDEWALGAALNLRSNWRFMSLLTKDQRKAVMGETGLDYRQIPVSLQSKFAALIFSNEREASKAEIADISSAKMTARMVDKDDNPTANAPKLQEVRFKFFYGGGSLPRMYREIGVNSTSSGQETPKPPARS
jgi:hypothetical protein